MKIKKILTKEEVHRIIKKYKLRLGPFTIRDNGLIDVEGNVKICYTNLNRLPLKFGNVYGNFICHSNKLMTLKGFPIYVAGDFNIHNNNLRSLEYGPVEVGGDYFCNENSLTSLKGSPVEISGKFNCALNHLKSLVYSPKLIGKGFYAHHNKLSTLTGCPQYVGGSFNVGANLLRNLEGLPEYIGTTIHFDFWIPSLYIGNKNCYVKTVKIELLERINKDDNTSLPKLILDNQKHLPILFKYNKYLDKIWSKNGLTNEEELLNILLDIKQGLR